MSKAQSLVSTVQSLVSKVQSLVSKVQSLESKGTRALESDAHHNLSLDTFP